MIRRARRLPGCAAAGLSGRHRAESRRPARPVRDGELLRPGRPPGRAGRGGSPRNVSKRLEQLSAPSPRPRDPGGSRPARIRTSTWRSAWNPGWPPVARGSSARWHGWRTERFDARLARRRRAAPARPLCWPSATSARIALCPACRRLGIPTILSMVHGDVREEREVLEREAEVSPEFLPIYLGNGATRSRRARLAARTPPPRARPRRPHRWSPRSTSPRRSYGTAPRASGSRDPLRRRLPAVPAASGKRTRPTVRSCSPAGSASGRGSSTCSKPGGASAARAGGSSSWAPPGTSDRCGPTWMTVELLGRVATPRCPRAWPRPTSSCSPRSSRARRS